MTIRDLDEDYNTGKLSSDAYETEREYWSAQGVQLLQQLQVKGINVSAVNKTAKASHSSQKESDPEQVLDEAIEDAIRAYVQASSSTAAPTSSERAH